METYSSVLAWRIPGTGEPGGLPSMRSQSWTRLKRLSSSSGSRHKCKDTLLDRWNNKKLRLLSPQSLTNHIKYDNLKCFNYMNNPTVMELSDSSTIL